MKNHPPNVFLSSTMYDLSELRAQLRQLVEGLGWHAVMSESVSKKWSHYAYTQEWGMM